jgi:hypothetical protein
MFGDWIYKLEDLCKTYNNAKPFEHVIIKNFFQNPDTINIPDPDSSWHVYDNPFEGKYLKSTFEDTPELNTLNSDEIIHYVSEITGIKNLECDPYLNAGGFHAYPRNGRSGIHLDYTMHPITGKERRVSLLVYMSKDWKEEWGGNLKIWDSNLENETTLNHDLWNTAILFKTNGLCYHGFPEPIKCPEGIYRKAIGVFYLTDPTEEALKYPRNRANYFPRKGQNVPEQLQKLYDIRINRRINQSDLDEWPTWRLDCGLI